MSGGIISGGEFSSCAIYKLGEEVVSSGTMCDVIINTVVWICFCLFMLFIYLGSLFTTTKAESFLLGVHTSKKQSRIYDINQKVKYYVSKPVLFGEGLVFCSVRVQNSS